MGLDGDAGCERRRRCEGQIRRGRMLGPIGIFAIAALLRIEPSHNSAAADLPGVQRHATARVQVSGKGAARREGFHGFLSIRLDVGHEKGIPAPMFRLRLRGGGAAAEDGGGASGGSGGGDGEGWKSAFEAACQATAMAGDEEPELAAGSAPSNGQAGWGSIAGGGAGMVDGFLKGEEEELEGWSKTDGQKEKNEKKATGKREGKDGGSAVVELERGTGRGGDVDDEGDVKLDVAAAAGVGAVGRIDGERVGGARRQADKPSRGISKKLGDKPGTHIKLIGAEQLGKSRRDSFEKRELEGLKETMSFAEWRKLVSIISFLVHARFYLIAIILIPHDVNPGEHQTQTQKQTIHKPNTNKNTNSNTNVNKHCHTYMHACIHAYIHTYMEEKQNQESHDMIN
jgi:hypothetical protein